MRSKSLLYGPSYLAPSAGDTMAMPNIPQDLQEKLAQFEQLKQQLQMVISQRGEMEARKREVAMSIEALKGHKGGDVFRQVGGLLLKVDDIEALRKDLEEEAETIGVRVSSMEKQESQIKKMYESLGSELNEALRGYQ